jgi:hypothetical protein
VAGRTKRTVVLSLVFVAYCAGSATGAQIFQSVSSFESFLDLTSLTRLMVMFDRMMLLVMFELL